MDWITYKALCNQPDILTRWALSTSTAMLAPELAAPLQACLEQPPLAKPPDLSVPPALDMFALRLQADAAEAILRSLRDEAQADPARHLRQSQIDHLLVVWSELVDYLAAAETVESAPCSCHDGGST